MITRCQWNVLWMLVGLMIGVWAGCGQPVSRTPTRADSPATVMATDGSEPRLDEHEP